MGRTLLAVAMLGDSGVGVGVAFFVPPKWNIRSRVAIIIRIRSDITPTQSAQESPA
jgi:hypothetical protein